MLVMKFHHCPHTIISYYLFFTICAFFRCSVEGEAKGDLEARETKAFSRASDLLEMSLWKTKFKQTFGNITFNEQFNETFGNVALYNRFNETFVKHLKLTVYKKYNESFGNNSQKKIGNVNMKK